MSAATQTTYILAVPGTDQTRELSRENLLAELARGEVTPDFWIWSAEHHDWKQISELPALFSPVPPAPSPIRVPAYVQPLPQPQQPTPVAAKKKKVVRRRSSRVEMDHGFPYVKFIFGVLYLAVILVAGLNYLVVDKPLDETLAHSSFVLVPVHAHMGSFVQPNALVIHVLPNKELTTDNLQDFLQSVANSTPNQPFQEKPYEMVTFTSGWFSQFAMTGSNWKSLAAMTGAKSEDRRNFIADHLCNIAGQPLIRHANTLGLIDLKAARDQTWQQLTSELISHG